MGRVFANIEKAILRFGILSAMTLLPLLIAVRIFEIYTRNLTSNPSSLYNAMESELFILFVFFSIAAAYLGDAHVRVDILRDRFSARTKAAIEFLGGLLFVLPLGCIVLWYGAVMVESSFSHQEKTALALGAPYRWVIIAAMPFGIGLFCLAILSKMFRALQLLLRRSEDPGPAVFK
jgi:TRAP-type mannitol/chloroaromatic compound transport system permease small subunit